MNTNTISRKIALPIAAALLVALGSGAFPAPAHAGDRPRVAVSFADLNLSSHLGAAVLYRRIEAAAVRACRTSYRFDETATAQIRRVQCQERAVRNAVKTIHARLLIAIYNAHHRAPLRTTIEVAQAR